MGGKKWERRRKPAARAGAAVAAMATAPARTSGVATTPARAAAEPDPSDWPAWRRWHDAREPEDGEAWAEWDRERELRKAEAERRSDDILNRPHVRLIIEHPDLTGTDLCAELWDYGLDTGGCGLWLDQDADGNWLDCEDGLPRLAVPVDPRDGARQIEQALAAAKRAERHGWRVTGFERGREAVEGTRLVNVPMIAALSGWSTFAVRGWTKSDTFPPPRSVATGVDGKKRKVWEWDAVAAWLTAQGRFRHGRAGEGAAREPRARTVERINRLWRESRAEEGRADHAAAMASIAEERANPDRRSYTSAEVRAHLGLDEEEAGEDDGGHV